MSNHADGFRAVCARIVLVAMACVACAPANAQIAGNTHPNTHVLSEDGVGTHPFGQPASRGTATPEAKRDFEALLDLSPLADVAVFHSGRVKILDSLARETVRTLTGRNAYAEWVVPEGTSLEPMPEGVRDEQWRYSGTAPLETHKFAPMFVLMDLTIDPAHYYSRPLIAIDYLPLRKEMLAMALPGDGEDNVRARGFWLGTTRVSPAMVDAFATPIYDRHQGEAPFRTGVNRAERARELFAGSVGNWVVVAPPAKDEPWAHLGSLPAAHPARAAAGELGEAWRAMDADRANDAIVRLASALGEIHPETVSQGRLELELYYNRLNAFEWGLWAYLASFVSLVLAFATGRRWLAVLGVALFLVAISMHGLGFGARCVLANRFAIQNQFESMTGVSLFGALVGLVLMVWKRRWLFGAAAAGAGFLILVTATQTAIPGKDISPEAAILNTSVLLKYHVTTVLTSYALITLGLMVSLFYLGTHYGAKFFGTRTFAVGIGGDDTGSHPGGNLQRTLKDLDTAQMTVLQLAFWTLGVGILLGAWWADHSWGRWWAFDPKETWALVTWIVYLIVIHLRFSGIKNRGLTTAWLSVVGFIVMLWTYFGVNLLLPGLHAYA